MPLLGYLVGLWFGGRVWFGLELFGSAPDPTAVATLGLMAIVRPRFAWILVILPTLWCLTSAATLAVLGDPLWPLPLLAVLTLALVAAKGAVVSGPRRRGPSDEIRLRRSERSLSEVNIGHFRLHRADAVRR